MKSSQVDQVKVENSLKNYTVQMTRLTVKHWSSFGLQENYCNSVFIFGQKAVSRFNKKDSLVTSCSRSLIFSTNQFWTFEYQVAVWWSKNFFFKVPFNLLFLLVQLIRACVKTSLVHDAWKTSTYQEADAALLLLIISPGPDPCLYLGHCITWANSDANVWTNVNLMLSN